MLHKKTNKELMHSFYRCFYNKGECGPVYLCQFLINEIDKYEREELLPKSYDVLSIQRERILLLVKAAIKSQKEEYIIKAMEYLNLFYINKFCDPQIFISTIVIQLYAKELNVNLFDQAFQWFKRNYRKDFITERVIVSLYELCNVLRNFNYIENILKENHNITVINTENNIYTIYVNLLRSIFKIFDLNHEIRGEYKYFFEVYVAIKTNNTKNLAKSLEQINEDLDFSNMISLILNDFYEVAEGSLKVIIKFCIKKHCDNVIADIIKRESFYKVIVNDKEILGILRLYNSDLYNEFTLYARLHDCIEQDNAYGIENMLSEMEYIQERFGLINVPGLLSIIKKFNIEMLSKESLQVLILYFIQEQQYSKKNTKEYAEQCTIFAKMVIKTKLWEVILNNEDVVNSILRELWISNKSLFRAFSLYYKIYLSFKNNDSKALREALNKIDQIKKYPDLTGRDGILKLMNSLDDKIVVCNEILHIIIEYFIAKKYYDLVGNIVFVEIKNKEFWKHLIENEEVARAVFEKLRVAEDYQELFDEISLYHFENTKLSSLSLENRIYFDIIKYHKYEEALEKIVQLEKLTGNQLQTDQLRINCYIASNNEAALIKLINDKLFRNILEFKYNEECVLYILDNLQEFFVKQGNAEYIKKVEDVRNQYEHDCIMSISDTIESPVCETDSYRGRIEEEIKNSKNLSLNLIIKT